LYIDASCKTGYYKSLEADILYDIQESIGFTSDHSSTSYEFFVIDKPLNKEAIEIIGSLSRRANPTRRRVSFVYHELIYTVND